MIRAFDVHDGKLVWNWDSGNPDETEPWLPAVLYPQLAEHVVAGQRRREARPGLPAAGQPDARPVGRQPHPGAEKFSAGLVALDLNTGKLRWNYQFTHHDLWDMDVGSQPTLLDLKTADGVSRR